MNIDYISAAIFALFALLIFKHDFTMRITVFIGIVAAVLPLLATKLFTYLPYLISEMPLRVALTPSPAEITILLLRALISVLVLLIIRKDTENLLRFGIWVTAGIFMNDMLLPFLIH